MGQIVAYLQKKYRVSLCNTKLFVEHMCSIHGRDAYHIRSFDLKSVVKKRHGQTALR